MGLYERLMGLESPRLPVHQFTAAVNEYRRGKLSKEQANVMFGFLPAEAQEASLLMDRLTAVLTPLVGDEVHEVLMLAEQRMLPYDTVAAVKTRLGV